MKTTEFSLTIITLIFLISSYFVYGILGVPKICILMFISGVTIILSLIPFTGVFLVYMVNIYTYPFAMNYLGLYSTWLTTTLLYYTIFISAIITIATTAFILNPRQSWK